MSSESEHGVDLYWLPLGAGGHSVRLNGLVFEAVVARLERRSAVRPLPLCARGDCSVRAVRNRAGARS